MRPRRATSRVGAPVPPSRFVMQAGGGARQEYRQRRIGGESARAISSRRWLPRRRLPASSKARIRGGRPAAIKLYPLRMLARLSARIEPATRRARSRTRCALVVPSEASFEQRHGGRS